MGFKKVDAGSFSSKIRLEADEDEGSVRAKMEDFGVPLSFVLAQERLDIGWRPHLVHDIFQRVGAIDGEADKQEVGLRV